MVYKRIKRGEKGVPAKGGPKGGASSFKNKNKIGEATAKRMQEKLGRMGRAKK